MDRVRINIPKGSVTYKFRGSNYLMQPDKTYISKMYYYPDSNTTEIHLKRNNYILESIIGILICFILISNILLLNSYKQTLYYNSTVIQYDGNLYLNLTNDAESLIPIEVSVVVNDEVVSTLYLNPGDEIPVIEYSENVDTLLLNVEYKFPLWPKDEQIKCFVVRKE